VPDEFMLPHITNHERQEVLVEENINIENQEDGEEEQVEDNNHQIEEDSQGELVPLRMSSRQVQPPTRLIDFVMYTVQYPIQEYVSYNNISQEYCAFLNLLSKVEEPSSYEVAKKEPKWCKAMEEELQALKKNQTWELCMLPKDKKLVGCKWVYKIKYHSNGTIDRYKARLVAKGYTQTYGDYYETFATVSKMNTVRILLSIAVNND